MTIQDQIKALELKLDSLDKQWDRLDDTGQFDRQVEVTAEMLVKRTEIEELKKSLPKENEHGNLTLNLDDED